MQRIFLKGDVRQKLTTMPPTAMIIRLIHATTNIHDDNITSYIVFGRSYVSIYARSYLNVGSICF